MEVSESDAVQMGTGSSTPVMQRLVTKVDYGMGETMYIVVLEEQKWAVARGQNWQLLTEETQSSVLWVSVLWRICGTDEFWGLSSRVKSGERWQVVRVELACVGWNAKVFQLLSHLQPRMVNGQDLIRQNTTISLLADLNTCRKLLNVSTAKFTCTIEI